MPASEIKQKIDDAVKDAMRARDKQRVSALRLTMSEFKKIEVDERIELDDARVHDARLLRPELDLASLDASHRICNVSRRGATLDVGHEALGAEHARRLRDRWHHIGRREAPLKVETPFDDLIDKPLGTNNICAGCERLVGERVARKHGDARRLPHAVRQQHRPTRALVRALDPRRGRTSDISRSVASTSMDFRAGRARSSELSTRGRSVACPGRCSRAEVEGARPARRARATSMSSANSRSSGGLSRRWHAPACMPSISSAA